MGRLREEEDGAGLVSTLAGGLVFLVFLLFAVQLLVHLFAVSFIDAAAFDAARMASAHRDDGAVVARAHGLAVLGSFADRVSSFDVAIAADSVSVRVEARSPALLPAAFGRIAGIDEISRTVTLRREVPRCAGC